MECTENHQHNSKRNFEKDLAKQQELVIDILKEGTLFKDRDSFLTRALEIILSAPFTNLLPKGGIFIFNGKELELNTQTGLHTSLLTQCAKIKLGQCLCGMAALTRKLQYANCVDERHEVTYAGITPHGHYNIPILDADEKLMGVVVVYLPHGHPRRKVEEEFLTIAAQSIGMILARLKQQRELLELNQVLDGLIYRAAHDLQSPVANAKGMVAMMKTARKNKDEKLQLQLEEFTEESLDSLSGIISGFLEHAKFKQKESATEQNPDANKVLTKVLNEVDADLKKIDAHVSKKVEDIRIPGAEYGVESIIRNLITNAIKYRSSDRKLQLDINIYQTNGTVNIEVSDNGIGIDLKKYGSKLFQMFETLENGSRSDSHGIGLYNIKSIINSYGGTIDVKSVPNEGTTFSVKIPQTD